jgi:hypothetical protein
MKRGIWGRTLAGIAALCLVSSVGLAAGKGKEAIAGNWDLDVAKSNMAGIRSGHVSVSTVKDGFKAVVDYVPASGAAIHYEYSGGYDGMDIPVAGNTYFDSCTMLRIDRNTTIRTERRGGKVVGITTIEIAKDGKTFSASSKGTLPDGHQFARATVFNRAKM